MEGIKSISVFLIILSFFSLRISEAQADFRVCNATQNPVGASIGYRDKKGWKSEGWWYIDRLSCKTLLKGNLTSRYYYLYAEDAEKGNRWEGPITMCVSEGEFIIEGVSNCIPRGYQRANFQEHDTKDQASWMVQLTESSDSSKPLTLQAPH